MLNGCGLWLCEPLRYLPSQWPHGRQSQVDSLLAHSWPDPTNSAMQKLREIYWYGLNGSYCLLIDVDCGMSLFGLHWERARERGRGKEGVSFSFVFAPLRYFTRALRSWRLLTYASPKTHSYIKQREEDGVRIVSFNFEPSIVSVSVNYDIWTNMCSPFIYIMYV